MKLPLSILARQVVLFIALLFSTAAFGQSDSLYMAVLIPYNPLYIPPGTAGGTHELTNLCGGPLGDEFSSIVPIGFPFYFYGDIYNEFVVSGNGYLSFDILLHNSYSSGSVSASMPGVGANLPRNGIMVAWEDLDATLGGHIFYVTTGVTPNRICTIVFDSVAVANCPSSTFSAQIMLYETAGIAEIHIGNKDNPCMESAIEGVVNKDHSFATIVPGRNFPAAWSASQDAWQFIPDLPVISSSNATITGRLYADLNQNCIFDGNDYGLASRLVSADTSSSAITDSNGFYSLGVDTGNYILTHEANVFYQSNCPANNAYNISLPVNGSTLQNMDFADIPTGNCDDLSANIATYCVPECNYFLYTVDYCNNGPETTLPVYIDITMPDSVSLASSIFPFTTNGNVNTFKLPPLCAYSCGTLQFQAFANCALPIGETKCVTASIYGTPDCDSTNNTAEDCHVIAGPLDPNFVVVASNSLDYVYGETINADDTLTYQINFQNVGNEAAVNIVVIDTLPATLDATTVSTTIASSAYTVNNNNGVLTWTFNNINLPDSGTNQLMSHGLVRFKVRQQPSNLPGTIIPNQASIYFDANAPVVTNNATDTIYAPTYVAAIMASKLSIYPNPAHDVINLQYAGLSGDMMLTVYNRLGAIATTQALPANSAAISTKEWPAGVYLLKLTVNGVQVDTKSVVVE